MALSPTQAECGQGEVLPDTALQGCGRGGFCGPCLSPPARACCRRWVLWAQAGHEGSSALRRPVLEVGWRKGECEQFTPQIQSRDLGKARRLEGQLGSPKEDQAQLQEQGHREVWAPEA